MATEFLDKTGLTYLWGKLKAMFAPILHTHTREDILPIASKTFTGVIGTANNFSNATFYYGKILPDDYYTPWSIKFKVYAEAAGEDRAKATSEVIFTGTQSNLSAFHDWNMISDTSYRPAYYHVLYKAKAAGITNGYGHALGIQLYSGWNPTTAANARTFKIEIYECINCTFAFFDEMLKYASIPGTGSTNYSGYSQTDFYQNGLREYGDDNTQQDMEAAFGAKTGAQGVWSLGLCLRNANGLLENICTASDGTATSTNRTTEKTKIANTNGFLVGSSVYLGSASFDANSNINTNSIWNSYSAFDSRYSLNTELVVNSLTPYLPVYLVGTISDGLFYLDDVWWTQTPTDTSKVYILVGGCYDSTTSTCRISLYQHNPWVVYDGTKLVPYTAESSGGGSGGSGTSGIKAENVSVTFVADTSNDGDPTYAEFPYRGTYTNASVTADMMPQVAFSLEQEQSLLYAPICATFNGGVYLYAAKAGTAVIPSIFIHSGETEEGPVRFFDYDGSVVKSYTAEDFAVLTALPDNPSHTGLTAQGWNWTLADAKEYVALHGALDIGQCYVTDDGTTRLYITLGEDDLSVEFQLYQSAANGVSLDWGDDSAAETNSTVGKVSFTHTYAAVGDYVITITVLNGTWSPTATSNTNEGKYTGSGCFSNHAILRKAELEDNISVLNNKGITFLRNNYNLETISVPVSLITINNGSWPLAYCTALKHFTYPSGSAGGGAFKGCNSLESVSLPKSYTSIGNYHFQYCFLLESVCLPEGITALGNYTFQYCESLKRLILPTTLASIPGGASIGDCHSLETLIFPSTMTKCFCSNLYKLKTLKLPTSVSEIQIKHCYGLDNVAVPSGVTTLADKAMENNHILKNVTIPASVTSIGSYALSNNFLLEEVHLLPTTPPTLANTNAFSNCERATFYVPTGSLTAYQEATNWSAFADRMVEE